MAKHKVIYSLQFEEEVDFDNFDNTWDIDCLAFELGQQYSDEAISEPNIAFIDNIPVDEWIAQNTEVKWNNEKLQTIWNKAKEQGKKSILKFMMDMRTIGYEDKLRAYQGRFFYNGVGVVNKCIDEILQNTTVPCNSDGMGLDFIVYPRQSLTS